MRAIALRGVDDPREVLLTPGVHNAAHFEYSFLARQMGVELVEGRDLVCRNNVLYMRTTSGEERVDVVSRRVDDESSWTCCISRPDSMPRVRGGGERGGAGNVSISNFVGNGVRLTTRPSIRAFRDDRVLTLGERAILDNAETFPLDDALMYAWALDHVDTLVW